MCFVLLKQQRQYKKDNGQLNTGNVLYIFDTFSKDIKTAHMALKREYHLLSYQPVVYFHCNIFLQNLSHENFRQYEYEIKPQTPRSQFRYIELKQAPTCPSKEVQSDD